MSASLQDYKGKGSAKKKGNISLQPQTLFSFLLWLLFIIVVYTLINHFIQRWDGHFHDTKGCTFLQNMNGKLYKVNSCDNSVVPLDANGAGSLPSNFNQIPAQPDSQDNKAFIPGDNEALPPPVPAPVPKQQAPVKKPHGKDAEPHKESPYMI